MYRSFTRHNWSLYYGLVYLKTRKPKRMLLKLPKVIRGKMHSVMKGRVSKNLIGGAFVAGVVVSLLDSLCAGQIYLPVLALISQSQARYFYLLLYNLMFILPLVIVLTAVCLGMGFRRLIELSERYTTLTKLLLAGVFFALAGLLVLTV